MQFKQKISLLEQDKKIGNTELSIILHISEKKYRRWKEGHSFPSNKEYKRLVAYSGYTMEYWKSEDECDKHIHIYRWIRLGFLACISFLVLFSLISFAIFHEYKIDKTAEQYDDTFAFHVVNDELWIKSYKGDKDTITIPNTYTLHTGVIPNTYNITGMSILCISKGTNLIIPKNIAHIDFSRWSNIDYISCYDDLYSSIVVDESNPIYDSRENCNGIIETSTNTLIFASKAFQFPSNIEIIGENSCMFYNEKNLILPKTVKEIQDYAFAESSNLESVILPYSLQHIGDCIFSNCNNLKYVFFEGTKYQYTKISQNESRYIYFYSDSKPSIEGNFWHYVDNKPEIWVE